MTENEFLALGRAGYNRIPLHLETLADLDTPLSIYLKLANRPGSYLLESVIGGERFGRYSIVGLPARERLEVRGQRVSIVRDGGVLEQREHDDPLEFIDGYLALVQGCAARERAALRRRPGGLLRLRHGALHRAAPGAGRPSPIPSACRRSGCCCPTSSRSSTTSRASCT